MEHDQKKMWNELMDAWNNDYVSCHLYFAKLYTARFPNEAAGWIRGNINKSEGTVRTYHAFLETFFHEYSRPGNSYSLVDFETDPRIYVFLRQQLEECGNKSRLDELLVDSLIIFSLEATDPDKDIFMSREEISKKIEEMIKFSPKLIDPLIDKRLKELSTKPRRINHHTKINKYCLPFQTRLRLEEKNIDDIAMYGKFFDSVEKKLKNSLSSVGVNIEDVKTLLEKIINNLFKQQGLEFAEYVIQQGNGSAVEKSLPDIIYSAVDESSIKPEYSADVKSALVGVVRDIIYKGTLEEREYLRRLSKTYMLLFLLQCDPKVAKYFGVMANKTNIFVCNSLLVPALSEFDLEQSQRRHWNLLVNAKRAGIKLIVTKEIINELCGHIRKAIQRYDDIYKGLEAIYSDEMAIKYIDEILIRSYFYTLNRGKTHSFYDFIDNFVTVKSGHMDLEIIEWLKYNFGIEYIEESKLDVALDQDELRILTEELSKHKRSPQQARTDAKTVLNVCAMREIQNETGSAGIFGYQTWWLSKDTKTQISLDKCFGDKYTSSCYIRPDFLYNYISLAPDVDHTNKVFDSLFPSLAGVTISHHIPNEICTTVNQTIKEHAEKDPARIRAIIRVLTDRLKSDASLRDKNTLKHFLDEEFAKI